MNKIKLFDGSLLEVPDYTNVEKIMEGMYFWRNPKNRLPVLLTHFSSDPEKKTEEWINYRKTGLSPDEWEREYNINFNIEGDLKSIFRNCFNPEIHIKEIEYMPNVPLIGGWDFGRRNPAVIFVQIYKDQIRVLREMLGDDILLRPFALQVLEKAKIWFPKINTIASECEWVADIAGTQVSDKSEFSSIELLNALGIYPDYRKFNIKPGIYLIEAKLAQKIGEERGLLIHPSCKLTIEGFSGGYKWDKAGLKPQDSIYNHLMDGLRYIISHRFSIHEIKDSTIQAKIRPMTSDEIMFHDFMNRKAVGQEEQNPLEEW